MNTTYHHIAVYASFIAPGCFLQSGAFCFSKRFFWKSFLFRLAYSRLRRGGLPKGDKYWTRPPGTKGGENMDYPNRLEWQTRCEFNAYCKRALRNELIDACRERKRRQLREVIFFRPEPRRKKGSFTPLTSIFKTATKKPFAQEAWRLPQNCLPKLCTPCRTQKDKPYCCTTFSTWPTLKLRKRWRSPAAQYSIGAQALLNCWNDIWRNEPMNGTISNNSDERGLLLTRSF